MEEKGKVYIEIFSQDKMVWNNLITRLWFIFILMLRVFVEDKVSSELLRTYVMMMNHF